MYALLDKYYSHGMDRDEIDARGALKRKWRFLVKSAEDK